MAHNEVVTLCSDKVNSTTLNPHPDSLSCFSWEDLYLEISNHCPILTQVMKCGTSTRQPRTNQKAIICLCMAIMCNNRPTSMSLVQQIISVLLYTGHAAKEVSLPTCSPSTLTLAANIHKLLFTILQVFS